MAVAARAVDSLKAESALHVRERAGLGDVERGVRSRAVIEVRHEFVRLRDHMSKGLCDECFKDRHHRNEMKQILGADPIGHAIFYRTMMNLFVEEGTVATPEPGGVPLRGRGTLVSPAYLADLGGFQGRRLRAGVNPAVPYTCLRNARLCLSGVRDASRHALQCRSGRPCLATGRAWR